ncbi:MAG: nucleotidyltransferase family protein [Candidatus Thermoplasmatota archaeon]|nr:nucleotidyltransferase family protein [Candidatus Thermoplasmatota archaeon]MBU4255725.1 nucleotidyltransferase family protein [Candidatus Thermoplasmatota archaeon]MCG2826534.1 nucleotidyltransferase family protein [Thermoplasmatales archaeon]
MKSYKKIEKILKQHKRGLVEKYKVKEVGIFGSYIKGKQKKRSDIDILVEFEEVPDLFKFLELERHLEKFLGLKVDLVRKKALREELKDMILDEVVSI